MTIGTGGPLYATAAGRILLAFQSEEYQENYFETVERKRLTPDTVLDADVLRRQLKQIQRDRVWTSIGESVSDGAAFAAPVFGPEGDCICAIGVALPLSRLEGREQFLRDTVSDVAARASGTEVDAVAG